MNTISKKLSTATVGIFFVVLYGIPSSLGQDSSKYPGDHAYDLAQRLHDANGNYCAKPLTTKEAQFLTQYYGAHKNDPIGEQSILLSDSELQAAKSMAKGKCEQPAANSVTAGSSSAPRQLAIAIPPQSSPQISATPDAPPTAAASTEKPHVVRIGVAAPDAQIGQGTATSNIAEPLRTMLIQYLNGPGLGIAPVTAMLPAQIEAEAKAKGYDYVLYSSVTQKKSSGMSFLKAATMASSLTPIGAVAGATRAAAAAAASTAAATQIANVSSTVKARTEYTLAYKLVAAGNSSPILSNSATAKAKADGEDVITPLVQQTATAILGQVQPKK